MPKMAMHNDPMQRKTKYEKEGSVFKSGHHEGRVDTRATGQQGNRATGQQGNSMSNAIPGGSKFPSSKIGNDGTFGRADLHAGVSPSEGAGTSIFDPVLCELAYLWFSPKGGKILDPFAGGSVRGIVASKLEREYLGIDLRQEQIDANIEQANLICTSPMPRWVCGDSTNVLNIANEYHPDLIFSCPPYGDLEVYSDNPQDISTMEYSKFLEAYYKIIKYSVSLLKDNRFACFVVGDFRDKKGIYRNFVSHTIDAFIQAGAFLYNEAILVTSLGSLPIRAGKSFSATRKMGKTHQQFLVFIKGDPRKATEYCGEVHIPNLGNEQELPSNGVTAGEEFQDD